MVRVFRQFLCVFYAFSLCLYVGGCMSTSSGGPTIDPNAMAQLHEGMTRAEVEQMMSPSRAEEHPSRVGGGTTLIYRHSEGHYGFGDVGRNQMVIVMLSADGIVQRVVKNDTTTNSTPTSPIGVTVTQTNNLPPSQ